MRAAPCFLVLILSLAPGLGCMDTGPQMNPGENCQGCHDGSPAQRWAVAGTVFPCKDAAASDGLDGVTVTLTGPDGEWSRVMISNQAGNFYNADPLPTSTFRVAVALGEVRREMSGLVTSGACNTCHALPTTNGAPGRIFLKDGDCAAIPATDVLPATAGVGE